MATITRNEVASMLGVSVATVRRMEGKSLQPKLVDGVWRFEVDEVKKLRRESNPVGSHLMSEGHLAVELFGRFGQGQSLRQIVRECCQSPKVVRALYREWTVALGGTPTIEGEASVNMASRDEEEIAEWEDQMRAMIAADDASYENYEKGKGRKHSLSR